MYACDPCAACRRAHHAAQACARPRSTARAISRVSPGRLAAVQPEYNRSVHSSDPAHASGERKRQIVRTSVSERARDVQVAFGTFMRSVVTLLGIVLTLEVKTPSPLMYLLQAPSLLLSRSTPNKLPPPPTHPSRDTSVSLSQSMIIHLPVC